RTHLALRDVNGVPSLKGPSAKEVEVRRPLAPISAIFLCAAGVSGAGGCKQNSTDATAPTTSSPHDEDSTVLPEGWEPAIAERFRGGPAAGKVDVSNRYASTIMLTAAG